MSAFAIIAIRHDAPQVAIGKDNLTDAIDCAFDLTISDKTEVPAISVIGSDGELWPKHLMIFPEACEARGQIPATVLANYRRKSAA